MVFLKIFLFFPILTHVAAFASEGKTIRGTFSNSSGSRSFQLYVPSATVAKMPLFVVLHGCFLTGDQMVAGTYMNELAEQKKFLVLYPEQGHLDHPWKCWNWFKPENLQQNTGEASIIVGMTRKIIQEYFVDTDQVFISGISAGGALASDIMGCYSNLYTGIMVHSGVEYAAARTGEEALQVMKNGSRYDLNKTAMMAYTCSPRRIRPIPTIVFHGTKDSSVNPVNGTNVITQFLQINRLIQPEGMVTEKESRIDQGNDKYPANVTDILINGTLVLRKVLVEGMGHTWSGGRALAPYMDPRGVDASGLMVDFFLNK